MTSIRRSPLVALLLSLLVAGAASAQSPSAPVPRNAAMPAHAAGTFEVRMQPQSQDPAPGAALGRMSLDKTFHGELEGTGKGEMLTAITETQGSAVYVAIERVSGTLHGRTGTFALAHVGTMTRGAQELNIRVVPDSGTGELAGISGTLAIRMEGGKHFYDLAYTLPGAP